VTSSPSGQTSPAAAAADVVVHGGSRDAEPSADLARAHPVAGEPELCRICRIVSSLLAGIPFSSRVTRQGAAVADLRGRYRRFKVSGFISERRPT